MNRFTGRFSTTAKTKAHPGGLRHFFCRRGVALLMMTALALLMMRATAPAAPFSPSLSVTGGISFDTVFAIADGSASQSGSFSRIAGGGASTSTFSDTTVAGANPQAGPLTHIGDGFTASAEGSAAFDGGDAEFGVGIDLDFGITNTSATDTFKVTFKVAFDNFVDADGPDAFAESAFTVDDPFGEVFFTDLTSDTAFGDDVNGADPGTFGEALADAGVFLFDVVVDPLGFAAVFGALTLEGVAFDVDSAASARFSGAVTIDAVMNLTSPTDPIPEPGTVVLLGAGVLGLASLFRRRGDIDPWERPMKNRR